MKPPLTVTLDREKLNHPVHVKEEKSTKERRDKEMRKVRNNEGFTLAELLIVVAIIAVLVAVSIPIFTSQLEKSREATDLANMRAAKAALVTKVLDDDTAIGPFAYDANNGVLVDTGTTVTAYGKGTSSGEYSEEAQNKIFYVKYDSENEEVLGAWGNTNPNKSFEEAYAAASSTSGGTTP